MKAIRFGPTERVRPSLLDTTLERRLEAHPLHAEVAALLAEKDELFDRRDANGTLHCSSMGNLRECGSLSNGRPYR